jgi:hypothetical protein
MWRFSLSLTLCQRLCHWTDFHQIWYGRLRRKLSGNSDYQPYRSIITTSCIRPQTEFSVLLINRFIYFVEILYARLANLHFITQFFKENVDPQRTPLAVSCNTLCSTPFLVLFTSCEGYKRKVIKGMADLHKHVSSVKVRSKLPSRCI